MLQLGCPSRGESLHGDRDIEPAVVAHQAVGRRTLGVLAPFQLGSDPSAVARLRVHSTVLVAVGPGAAAPGTGGSAGTSGGLENSRSDRSN